MEKQISLSAPGSCSFAASGAPAVVLLQPPGTCRAFTRSGSVYPPLGLCQLAATVHRDRVLVLDADGLGWEKERTAQALREYAPRIVGMTLNSYTFELVETYAAMACAAGAQVMVGGPHASLAPVEVFSRCPSVTYAVRGEAEPIFPALVERVENQQSLVGLPGVCARLGGSDFHIDPTLLRVDDFLRLPFPRFDGLPLRSYQCPDARRRPMVTMMTTRGCPHRCAFCSSPTVMGKKVRGPAVTDVLDELERLVSVHGIREISFVDDVFTIQKNRASAICKGMIERELGLSWFCNARADQITKELAELMARAGCHQVYLGFESGSQEILDRIHKGATVAELVRGAELLRDAGIARSIGFVLGLPGESDETVAQSIELAQRVRPERLQFTRFTPLVGSPLSELRPLGGRGFHLRSDDPVGRWIAQAYAACRSEQWGKESW